MYDLHTIRDIAVFADGSLNEVFSGVFNRVSFSFGETIDMENLIDELEDAPGGAATLRYPPDCSECTIQLTGFVGNVRVDAARVGGGQPDGVVPGGIGEDIRGSQRCARGQPDAGTADSAPEVRRGWLSYSDGGRSWSFADKSIPQAGAWERGKRRVVSGCYPLKHRHQ